MSLIGNRIRLRREELGLTQDTLAHMCGYTSRSTIAKIEAGANEMTNKKLVKLAKALETTPEYLLGIADEEPQNDSERVLLSRYNSLPDDSKKLIDDLIERLIQTRS